MFSKILIANRGEIACRVIQTARRLGIRTVAVYSDADRHARHVRLADEAWPIGPAPSRESYLRMDVILQVARDSGAQAIHPGYGFLSENEEFAGLCEAAGVVFVGPPASAITAMGSKSGAKALMETAGVPLIPGYHGDNQDSGVLLAEARRIGFPVLLKASAGGGGKGMRAVHQESEFAEALSSAQREALAAFGDDHMLIEKLLVNPRHIEVQVMADSHGQAVYLFDRDCSLQRRHQKVVEEAPAPNVPDATRQAMGEAAVRAAQSIAYRGAGTIEFLLDQSGDFYFMEMNTRLQVEHPVTEAVTGLDLVELQLRLAAGEKLPFRQEDLKCQGHAVEVRLYAEDPENDFLPSTGTLEVFDWQQDLPGLRVDTGVERGDAVTMFYDPMIAKFITRGDTRLEACRRMTAALGSLKLHGLRHNGGFLRQLVGHPAFESAKVSTHFIADHRSDLHPPVFHLPAPLVVAAAIAIQQNLTRSTDSSPWARLSSWRLNGQGTEALYIAEGEATHKVLLSPGANEQWQWSLGDSSGQVFAGREGEWLTLEANDRRARICLHEVSGEKVLFFIDGYTFEFSLQRPDFDPAHKGSHEQHYRAPMNGRIIAVDVLAGQSVKAHDTLLIMEAMKMEHRIRAHADGIVKSILVNVSDLVNEGQALIDIDTEAQ